MKVQAYTQYDFTLTITVATPRAQEAPSTHFQYAKIHEDYCASVSAALREFKHVGAESLQWPAAKRLSNYFPTFSGSVIYALRQLIPAGAPRDVDADWQLEVMRIRYGGVLNLLPAAFLTGEVEAEAMSRNIQDAVKKLFQALSIPDVFIPGNDETRPGDRTEIDIICEMGAATARTGVEIPAPAQT